MNPHEVADLLLGDVEEWYEGKRRRNGTINTNVMAVGLVMIDHMAAAFPHNPTDYQTRSQVSGLSGGRIRAILARHGETHVWAVAVTVALGAAIGLVVHRLWAPCGATIQGYYVDKAVDRAIRSGHVPAWVRYPIAPPMLRERFAWILQNDPGVSEHSPASKGVIWIASLLAAYFVVTGFIAHFWIGTGHTFPYLAP